MLTRDKNTIRSGIVLASGTKMCAAFKGCRASNLNLGPSVISDSIRAKKLNLKIPLDTVKYLLWSQK